MIEIKGNIWDFHANGKDWVCITTNGFLKNNGCAVMGRGCAKQAAQRFPQLPKELGTLLKLGGNQVYTFATYRIFTFPTKHNWFEDSDVKLIQTSFLQLLDVLGWSAALSVREVISKIYLPRPGCSNGNLDWESEVKPALEPLFEQHKERINDRITIISL